jgi:hypothetical protein
MGGTVAGTDFIISVVSFCRLIDSAARRGQGVHMDDHRIEPVERG